jgi:diacylglycerol kinase family enzyme
LSALREEWERVDPPRRPVLLINPRSGDGKPTRAALADRARERGVEPVVLGPGNDLATLILTALDKGADALGMAGGDGSLAPVAAAAAEGDLPFI